MDLFVLPRSENLPLKRHKHPIGMDPVQAARNYSQWSHEGERLKFVRDVYDTHPKAVAQRMNTAAEKIVAFLHDVVENRVKEILGKDPDPAEEEKLIQQILKEIEEYFRNCGCDVSHLIPCIDILTKRVTDIDYQLYIQRVADFAVATNSDIVVRVKLADIKDNKRKDRNPAFNLQTEKDIKRLARYDWAEAYLQKRFPHIILRPGPDEKTDYRARRGMRTRRKLGIDFTMA